jgi:hypothetical protein
LTPGGSSTVHIYTQTVHWTQWNRVLIKYMKMRIYKFNNMNIIFNLILY